MKEKTAIWIAWLLPRRVAYWAAIRAGAHATQCEFSAQIVPELTMLDALHRW
jgi:hypothetical protein